MDDPIKQAIHGQAIDMHLLGLKMQAIEDLSALPEIFMDTSYAVALHYNLSTSQYKILLYGRKQKQITTARFHRGFVLKVCIARLNTESSPDSLVIQDLVHGEGQAVDVGDTVEVAFSGWLLQNHSLGQIFDSNLGKEKLRAAKRGCLVCRKEVDVSLLSLLSWVLHQTVSLTMCHPPALWSLMWRSIGTYCEKFSKDRHTGELGDTFSTSPGPSPDTLTEESTTQLVTTDTNESGDQAPKWKVESIRECLKGRTGYRENRDFSRWTGRETGPKGLR
ncbi:FK506-binding protein 15 isoform X2 [Myxocyprinus asiaticus]|uniref:FK506-binding protein 15 isoform X2 n=1 Tax=Myxocyprinus asiaticus TaxID=70543 RepID=UPI0022239C87|nr:FK506-binding protein 15 isoform X2 [Myxocyprinus asiaticus]